MNNIINVKELKEKIINIEKLKPGDKLSKERVLEIAEKYGLSPYVLAIFILNVSQAQYRSINTKSANANNIVILKDEIPNERISALQKKNYIIEKENLKKGDLIDYDRLHKLSIKYDIPENILVLDILLITENSYSNLKRIKNYKATIELEEKTNDIALRDEATDKIRNEILRKENIRIEDKINYELFKQISDKYNISESRLASDIFGISNSSYTHICADANKNAVILKDFLTKKDIEEYKEKIFSEEEISDEISYKELLILSNKYLLNDQLLAKKILGLRQDQYHNLKYKKGKAVIPKKENKSRPKSLLRKLRYRIFKTEQLDYGESISFDSINIIQQKYSLLLDELLYIFGISHHSYATIKNDRSQNAIIKNSDYFAIASIIFDLLEKDIYYSKEYIERLCEENNIPFKFFYEYIIGKSRYKSIENCLKILNESGKVYIANKSKKEEKNDDCERKTIYEKEYDPELIRAYYFSKISQGYKPDIALRLTSKSYELDKLIILDIINSKKSKGLNIVLK